MHRAAVRIAVTALVAAAVACSSVTPTLALDPNPRKWASGFAGVTFGQSKQRSYEFSPGTVTDRFEDTDFAFIAFGGYQVMKYFAVAGAWVDLGTTRVAGTDPGPSAYTDELKASGFNTMVMGTFPVAPKHALFTYLGAFRWSQDVSYTDPSGNYKYNDSGISPSFGVGYNWYVLDQNLGIHFEYSRFFKVGEKNTGSEHQSDRDFVSAGVVWSFR